MKISPRLENLPPDIKQNLIVLENDILCRPSLQEALTSGYRQRRDLLKREGILGELQKRADEKAQVLKAVEKENESVFSRLDKVNQDLVQKR